ncbi:MAG: transposase [Candidatus Daviesbacteria bacterium]|nr:transposase [Candidatus Daviesbacteria bacterium]
MKDLPNRQSIRLRNYDYSSEGAYFVTICTQNREMLFGDIVNGIMVLNDIGKIVEFVWESLPQHYKVELGPFQIMPNHIHMIIMIVGAGFSRPITLGNIIAYFKYQSTKQINTNIMGSENPTPTDIKYPKAFQRNYFEHVIRNEKDFDKISWYIENNPQMWDEDENNITG